MFKISKLLIVTFLVIFLYASPTFAATSIPFTINLSKVVNVTGTPRIAVDVGGVTRYATYTSGSGTSALTFTYSMVAGDVDLDGVTVSSPMDLNGGTVKDLSGNDLSPLTFTPPNTTNVKVNYPSLGMDFVADADGRYTLNGVAYNDLSSFLTATGGTFSRNSIGTYFDSAGVLRTATANTPRFDFAPVTNVAKGILIEESRTNLLTNSAVFTPVGGGPTFGTYVTDIPAPDGSTNGSRVTVASSREFVEYSVPNTTYTFSFYIKLAAGSRGMTLQLKDIQSDTVRGATNFTATTTWQRVSATGTVSGGSSGVRIELVNFAVGDHYWGAQLEQGAFPTSYIPTTGAAVTRAADVLTVPTGSWFSASQGSLSGELDFIQPIITNKWQGFFSIDDGTVQNSLRGWNDPNGAYYIQRQLAAVSAETSRASSFLLGNTNYKFSYKYSPSSLGGAISGNLLGNVAFSGLPTVSTLHIGASTGLGSQSGHFSKFKYYPATISDIQLQLLTQ